LLIFAHAETRFTSAVKTEQPEVVPLFIGLSTTLVLFFVYIHVDKKRIMLESKFWYKCRRTYRHTRYRYPFWGHPV